MNKWDFETLMLWVCVGLLALGAFFLCLYALDVPVPGWLPG